MYLPQQPQQAVNSTYKHFDEMQTSYSKINEWTYDRRVVRNGGHMNWIDEQMDRMYPNSYDREEVEEIDHGDLEDMEYDMRYR